MRSFVQETIIPTDQLDEAFIRDQLEEAFIRDQLDEAFIRDKISRWKSATGSIAPPRPPSRQTEQQRHFSRWKCACGSIAPPRAPSRQASMGCWKMSADERLLQTQQNLSCHPSNSNRNEDPRWSSCSAALCPLKPAERRGSMLATTTSGSDADAPPKHLLRQNTFSASTA